jgi:2-aminoadipate transaminase
MNELNASDIREILRLTQKPGVISFAGGLPAPECFPIEEMKVVAARMLEQGGRAAMQYSTTEGHPPLRQWLAGRMRTIHGIEADPDDVLITAGSQQGLDLSGKLFLDEGDVVLCESPTYLGALQAFQAYRPRFQEVATDDEGMIIEDLDKFLAATPRAKLIYVIPDFQNPTGRTWSRQRRERFLEVVRRYRVPVVEDNPYGELRFAGVPLPSLKSLDRDGLVVFLGTFSKIFCPGMRIGWLLAAGPLFEKYVILKQGADLHTSTVSQMQLATYLELYDIDANIARIREVYRRRRDAMVAAIDSEFPAGLRFTRPQGGLFLWVELPAGTDARKILAASLEKQVAFVPGGSFFPNGGKENAFRLNYSNMPEERIVEGIRRLGAVLRAFLDPAGECRVEQAV